MDVVYILPSTRRTVLFCLYLAPSINGLVTNVNTKLCCRGFVLELFRSTTAYEIGSGNTRDYMKLFLVYRKLKYYKLQ